jgi:hypothetical protein
MGSLSWLLPALRSKSFPKNFVDVILIAHGFSPVWPPVWVSLSVSTGGENLLPDGIAVRGFEPRKFIGIVPQFHPAQFSRHLQEW